MKNLSKKQDNFLTPFKLFGVECLNGWKELYMPLFEYVENYNKDKIEEDKIHILQVKEKWGHLEFYTDFYTDKLRRMVDMAYSKSEEICERCGSHNDVGMVVSGWFHTTCLECLLNELKPSKGLPKLPRKLKKAYKNKKEWATRKVKYGNSVLLYRNKDGKTYKVYPNGLMLVNKKRK